MPLTQNLIAAIVAGWVTHAVTGTVTGVSSLTVKGSTLATSYTELPNELVSGANGVEYAYRHTGGGEVPLVLLNHFRGNLDNWDPALIEPARDEPPAGGIDRCPGGPGRGQAGAQRGRAVHG